MSMATRTMIMRIMTMTAMIPGMTTGMIMGTAIITTAPVMCMRPRISARRSPSGSP